MVTSIRLGDSSDLDSMHKPLGSRLSVQRDAIFNLLRELALDNETHFRECHPSSYNKRTADICGEISSSIDLIRDMIRKLQLVSPKFDYDQATPGNGFRSLVCLTDVVLLHLISVLRICSENRTMLIFRLSHYCKELESFGAILRFLILTFQQVIVMLDALEENSLFPSLEGDYQQYNMVLKSIESLDATCFYGRPIGFQFCPSVTRIFRVLGLILATYSLSWESKSAAWGSLLSSGKLLLNPEQRAKRIVRVIRESDIGFCRGFWNLSELPMPKLFCPSMSVCEIREVQPVGSLPIESLNGDQVMISEPSSHTGVRSVPIKILSVTPRAGLASSGIFSRAPPSPHLVIHCHGGGYVATSSKSHETYLRSWAKSLNCPLVSIDYSLAPENPFPRPTEEVLYTYAWILNNPEKFGWTGEKVAMVGDSAGGNLITSVCLRLIELKAKRLPDGLVLIYTPFLFQYLPSPSRVLSFMDPLLHMGVVIRCAAAYTGSYSDEELDKNCTFRNTSSNSTNGHKSLAEYVDQVQMAQRDNLFDFSQGSQSIVSLINLSLFNRSDIKLLSNSSDSTKESGSKQPHQNDSHLLNQSSPSSAISPTETSYFSMFNNESSVSPATINSSSLVVECARYASADNSDFFCKDAEMLSLHGEEKDAMEKLVSDHQNDLPKIIGQSSAPDNGQRGSIQMVSETGMSTVAECEEEDEDSSDQNIQTVHVDSNPFHICLSATNFDQDLIDYLHEHPLTKDCLQSLDNNEQQQTNGARTVILSENNGIQQNNLPKPGCSIHSVNFESSPDDVFDSASSAGGSGGTLSKATKVDIVGESLNTSTEDGVGLKESPSSADGTDGLVTENFFTPDRATSKRGISSAGRTPYYKTPLSRNKCRSFSQSLADTAVLAAGHAFDNISEWFDTPTKEPMGFSDKKKLTRATTMSTQKAALLHQEEAENHHSHFTELLKLKLPRDYLMSPMYAQDEMLRKLPPIRFVACHLDPLLDDTIMFAKRLRKAGGQVESVDLLDSLPHGFLNFAPMSSECRDGAHLCLERLKQALGII